AATAKLNTLATLKAMCKAKGITYPPKRIFLRGLKQEKLLEVWASNGPNSKLALLKKYEVLAASGTAGPKRKEGDLQVPEGVYYVDRFNPKSRFHLSLGLNYPNKSDLIHGDKERPGFDIFIHGSNVSIGCFAMGDPAIEEIYTLTRSCRARIPVLLLPQRKINATTELWRQLKAINQKFEATKIFPKVSIDAKGNYLLK
ncbi:MAG TPA: L,D-transpeptidase family protein, partial [Fimbriimonas sp.]|nr:L,D-transpeptidase family protein [Fimbriimonas sp.]